MELKQSYLNDYIVIYWAIKTHTSQHIRKTDLRLWLFLSKQSVPRVHVWGQRQTELNISWMQNISYPKGCTQDFQRYLKYTGIRWQSIFQDTIQVMQKSHCWQTQSMSLLQARPHGWTGNHNPLLLGDFTTVSWHCLSVCAVYQAGGTIQFLHTWTM